MERLKPVLVNLAFFLTTLCAFGAVDKDYVARVTVEPPKEPVVEGGVFYLSVSSPDAIDEVSGYFLGHEIDFFPNSDKAAGITRYTALVGVDYGTQPGPARMSLKVSVGMRTFERKLEIPVRAGVFPSERLRVPPRTIAPSPKDQLRIKRDNVIISRAYHTKTTTRFWDPPAVLPVSNGTTSVFGTSRVYNGKKQNAHLGADLRAPTGTKVLAPIAGKVAVARNLFYTGYTVILDHGFGLFTIYGHMSKLYVKEGGEIKKGAVLGLSGATGRASGPHLHWGVNLHGTKVDPFMLVQALK